MAYIIYSYSKGLREYTISFEDVLRKGRATARCVFQISYSEDAVNDINISCYDVTKTMTPPVYVHMTDTMHKISIKCKIFKNGNVRVDWTRIKRGKRSF